MEKYYDGWDPKAEDIRLDGELDGIARRENELQRAKQANNAQLHKSGGQSEEKKLKEGESGIKSAKTAFTPQTPRGGRKYSGRVTYVDKVRETFITQYVYESGRLGYPVEHSMAKMRFSKGYSPRLSGYDLQAGDDVEITYSNEGDEGGAVFLSTAEQRDLSKKAARQAQQDKEIIEKYAHPKNWQEADVKEMAVLRESGRNKRFENVKVISKDAADYTVTTSNGQGDEFKHDAREWIGFGEIKEGDTLSIDYMKQDCPGWIMPHVENKTAEERAQKLGWGDPDFACGGRFDHVVITDIDAAKYTLTTQDAEGKKHVHFTLAWRPEKAMYQAGDVISIRLPDQDLGGSYRDPPAVLNHSYLGRIIGKYKMLDLPDVYPPSVLRNFPYSPSTEGERAWSFALRAIEDIKRRCADDITDRFYPYKSLTVTEIDKGKNTITAVNDKGEEFVHSMDKLYCANAKEFIKGDKVSVRWVYPGYPEKGFFIFNVSADDRQKAKTRFKEVRVIAVDREKDVFTTQGKDGEKFDHSMKGYKWKGRLQPGHLVTVQYEDNDVTKEQNIFNHTTYQESLIKALTRRTQEEALEKKPERAFTAVVARLGRSCVFLDEASGKEKPVFVSKDELTKALDCKSSDLKLKDEIQLKVKNLPKADGLHEIVSAKSKDVEERIQSQEQERGLSR